MYKRRKINKNCRVCNNLFGSRLDRENNYCSKKCYYKRDRKSLEKRFWSKVNKTDYCWEWTASLLLNTCGYGQFKVGSMLDNSRKTVSAHRTSYELCYGAIPRGMLVCHKCDNPKCVRPDHLFLGTHQDNSTDMCLKGRSLKGVKNK